MAADTSRISDATNLLKLLGVIGQPSGTIDTNKTTTNKKGGTVTETTSGTSETTQTNLSTQDVMGLITQLLGGSDGLTSVTTGQKNAGLYNSATNNQLVNDLVSRVATQVAAKAAPTTRTTAPTSRIVANDTTDTTQTVGSEQSRTSAGAVSGAGAATLAGLVAGNNLLGSSGGLSGLLGSAGKLGTGALNSLSDLFGSGKTLDQLLPAGLNNDLVPTEFDPEYFQSLFGDSGSSATDAVGNALSGSSGATLDELLPSGLNSDLVPNQFDADYFQSLFGDSSSAVSASGLPYTSAISNALDGEWGWGDTGAVVADYFVPGSGSIVKPIADEVGNVIDDIGSSIGDAVSGCFFTTACCEYAGLPDNCDELETLRAFRDGWVQETYPQDIKLYYRTAPKIVESIRQHPESKAILATMYSDYIVPVVQLVKAEKFEDAYLKYKELYTWLTQEI